jgi:predicted ATP-grasp superfamily ATP-dependent carboligase
MAAPGSGVVLLDPFNGGLAAVRALRRRGESVVVIAGANNSHTTRSRGVEGHFVPFVAGGEAWLDLLRRLAARGPQFVLTGTDAASAWLTAERERLPPEIVCFERHGDAHAKLMSKDTADAVARAAGVKVPWTTAIYALEDVWRAAAEAPWPCILKPVLSHRWRLTMGEDRVMLVTDPDEAAREAGRALAAGFPLVLSEYVPGGDGDVEEAIVVRAPDGTYPVAFGCRKIRQYPVGFGVASLCEVAELPESMALARAVLDTAGFVGVAGVETKRHAETGARYFLEVNVRIPTQWGLADSSGLDASARLVATLRGEAVGPQPPMRRRARLVYPEQDARAVLAALRGARGAERRAVAWRLVRSYAGTRDFGILDLRDPAPGLACLAGALGRRATARIGRRRRGGATPERPPGDRAA